MGQKIELSKIKAEKEDNDGELTDILTNVHAALSDGMVFIHNRIHENTKKSLEAASFLYALIELLNEKGLLSIAELDGRQKQVAERLVKGFLNSGNGLMHQNSEYDKYQTEHEAQIDCQNCSHICKAICCKLPFALSKQDVEEGVVAHHAPELMENPGPLAVAVVGTEDAPQADIFGVDVH